MISVYTDVVQITFDGCFVNPACVSKLS